MRQADHVDAFFSEVIEHANKEKGFALPFESSQKLCSMYVSSCEQKNRFEESQLERHDLLLTTSMSKTAIFKFLMHDSQKKLWTQTQDGKARSLLALLYYTWWADPARPIPQELLPTPETWNLFCDVINRSRRNEKSPSRGMSILARFVTAPHTLPASIFNTLMQAMVPGSEGRAGPHRYKS